MVLQEAVSFLQEAVAIGYGTQKKADITSSVQSVKADEFIQGAVIDAGQLIHGVQAFFQVGFGLDIGAGGVAVAQDGTDVILRVALRREESHRFY